jgi:hypothetical protein
MIINLIWNEFWWLYMMNPHLVAKPHAGAAGPSLNQSDDLDLSFGRMQCSITACLCARDLDGGAARWRMAS